MEHRPLVLGHRGASRARPENTLAAFAMARALGADGVELDVRRTADDQLVVHHDPHVGDLGLIASGPFATLRRDHPDVPTLDEALEACAGMLVNVEIKCLPWEPDADNAVHDVVRAVTETVLGGVHVPPDDVIVSSFDLTAIDACRAFAPGISTGWLTSGQDIARAAPLAADHGHAWLHPDCDAVRRASAGELADAQASGLRINVWTVDDPDDVRALADAGVDGLISNVPDVVLATLAELRARRP